MANYMGPYNGSSYSLFDDEDFKTAFSGGGQGSQRSPAEAPEPWISKNTQAAMASGGKSGGLSGALMSGGVSSMLGAESMGAAMAGGGPYAIAGGLLLSELQAAQEAKARQEAEQISNEKQRRSDMQNMLQQNSRTRFMV